MNSLSKKFVVFRLSTITVQAFHGDRHYGHDEGVRNLRNRTSCRYGIVGRIFCRRSIGLRKDTPLARFGANLMENAYPAVTVLAEREMHSNRLR